LKIDSSCFDMTSSYHYRKETSNYENLYYWENRLQNFDETAQAEKT